MTSLAYISEPMVRNHRHHGPGIVNDIKESRLRNLEGIPITGCSFGVVSNCSIELEMIPLADWSIFQLQDRKYGGNRD